LASLPDVELVGVVDANPERVQMIAAQYQTNAYTDFEPLFKRVDAVTVVVPTLHHHNVASTFLQRGIPVLVEKPIATTVSQADELIQLARQAGVAFQVGHIERFNPAFEELANRPICPKFIESERHGPFTGRSTDIGVVLDLMIHDLDLLLSLVGGPISHVEALGFAVFGGHEDIVNARLTFASGCIAHVTSSRVAQSPRRRLRVWASEGYAGVDFVQKRLTLVQPSDKLREHGLKVAELDPNAREQLQDELFRKHLESQELDCNRGDQLTNELSHFVKCVRTGKKPRVTGEDGREALALAERILDCVRKHPWDGNGACFGTSGLPAPVGKLFEQRPPLREAA
jgi:predicted dehydrogenase